MFRSAAIQRLVTWCAIVGYGLIVSGLPLPLGTAASPRTAAAAKRLAAKDRSTPFPCMDKACGCATAEQCFTNCCCHTAAETLAWARANKVDADVIAALQRRAAAPPARAVASCCSAAKTCCSAEPAVASAEPAAPQESAPEAVSPKSVSLRAMLACGGIVAEWFACGVSLPAPPVTVIATSDCSEAVACFDVCRSSPRLAPDVPPPRAG